MSSNVAAICHSTNEYEHRSRSQLPINNFSKEKHHISLVYLSCYKTND